MIYACYTIFITYMALGMTFVATQMWLRVVIPGGSFIETALITLLGVMHIVYVVRNEPIYNIRVFSLLGILWLIGGLGSFTCASLRFGQGARVLSLIGALETFFIVYSIAVDKPFYFAKIEDKTTSYIVWKRLMVWGFATIWAVSSVLPFLIARYGRG